MTTVTKKPASDGSELQAMPPLRNLEDAYELTPLQLDNLERYLAAPGAGLFHENLLFHFEGTVDTGIFTACWDNILERHTILRTSIYYRGLKKPVQTVNRKVSLPLEILDWRKMGSGEQEALLEQLTDTCRATDYRLDQAPLMRLSLILNSDTSFSIWWRFHHMIMDGWAFTVVLWDFLNLYRCCMKGEQAPALLPGYPYKEYVAYLKQRDTGEEEQFWKDYLRDFVPQKPLSKLAAPVPGSVTSAACQGRIDYPIMELYQPLQKAIKANELTMNSVFQGIFTLLMSHYSDGELDVVTGQTAADRPLSLTNSQARVGLFVNTLPLRCRINPQETFALWAKGLQSSMLNTFRFSASSEQEIKRWCGIPQEQEIFHSALVFKNIPLTDDPFRGLPFHMSRYSLESRPHFPLSVFVWPDEHLELKIIYDNRRYSNESAWDLLYKLRKGLEAFIEQPDLSVSDLMKFRERA